MAEGGTRLRMEHSGFRADQKAAYKGAQHGFGCDERGSYSKPDYDLAQERTVAFFARHLG